MGVASPDESSNTAKAIRATTTTTRTTPAGSNKQQQQQHEARECCPDENDDRGNNPNQPLEESPLKRARTEQGSIATAASTTSVASNNTTTKRKRRRQQTMDNASKDGEEELSMDDIHSFFLKDPVSAHERQVVQDEYLKERVSTLLQDLERQGVAQAYARHKQQAAQEALQQKKASLHNDEDDDEANAPQLVPRSYQLLLLQRAYESNTIVHLGTGMGKTLIAILLIKRMTGLEVADNDDKAAGLPKATSSGAPPAAHGTATQEDAKAATAVPPQQPQKPKQVVFLVPSVALVLQQTTTLRANLPWRIGTAYNATVHAEASRHALAASQVLVATHGAYLDLLLHYGDLFDLRRVSLLILDECHNCIKNAPYATLMRQFYHTLPTTLRPRVLGLTASPLINVKKKGGHNESLRTLELRHRLDDLEATLDARVVPLTDLGLQPQDVPAFLRKDAQEELIAYPPVPAAAAAWMECGHQQGLHDVRVKEFRQLQALFIDLGARVTGRFCQQLQRDLTRNVYEDESDAQFQAARAYLHRVATQCHALAAQQQQPYTPKLQALHALLQQQYRQNPKAVGLVFVQRRVTAAALHQHFGALLSSEKRGKTARGTGDCAVDTSGGDPAVGTRAAAAPAPPCDQFDDACDDDETEVENVPANVAPLVAPAVPKTHGLVAAAAAAVGGGQFDDASDDEDPLEAVVTRSSSAPTIPPTVPNTHGMIHRHEQEQLSTSRDDEDPLKGVYVKSSALVRKASSMFRRKSKNGKKQQQDLLPEDDEEDEEQEKSIRQVLNGLRRGDINLLIATSVVEEGIDVQACSFVIVLDALTSLKAFIQMKGRARHKDASFFVFEPALGSSADANAAGNVPLETVKDAEARVNEFLATRASSYTGSEQRRRALWQTLAVPLRHVDDNGDDDGTEVAALQRGQFATAHGTVTLRGAKSLLHRYALMQPMDPAVRAHRLSLRAHLPSFDAETQTLSIPSHLGTYDDLRVVSLPPENACGAPLLSTKDAEAMVSLRACVRLYRHGLLNERLLPLSEKDIQERFVQASQAANHHYQVPPPDEEEAVATKESSSPAADPASDATTTMTTLYLHCLLQSGGEWSKYMEELNPAGRGLAFLSWTPLPELPPPLHYKMLQFGTVTVQVGEGVPVDCTGKQIDLCTQFFEFVWNQRWKRRTKDSHFCSRLPQDNNKAHHWTYRIVSVTAKGQLDWDHMKRVLQEGQRSRHARADVVRSVSAMPRPRLWSPQYDANAVYLVYGPSDDTCRAAFPHDHDNPQIRTYQDYYLYQHKTTVPPEAVLFDAARQWQWPCRAWSEQSEDDDAPKDDDSLALKRVKLPQCLCLEAALADPATSLLLLLVPQVCHYVEVHVLTGQLLHHLQRHVPRLGQLLSAIAPRQKVVQAMTAKSANAAQSYEALEWLGDGVLKLVQTDALVNATTNHLGRWIRHLPEGYLNAARSYMGSNATLQAACHRLRLHPFVQTQSLSRGVWTPAGMRLVQTSTGAPLPITATAAVDGKVCADVMESLLGLVFVEFGYAEAMEAADALQLTIPHKADELLASVQEKQQQQQQSSSSSLSSSSLLLEAASKFTGYAPFQQASLVEEALTHPTKMSTATSYSSYQRLEWIGDAVLCLAVRFWIYQHLRNVLTLGDMVLLEATLVCNETLAFLAQAARLPPHLRHGDPTLPGRMEQYAWSLSARGLWGTNPPKTLADVAEALWGAVHVDGGVAAGQAAVYHALGPILHAVQHASRHELERYCRHPKRSLLSELGCLVSLEPSTVEALTTRYGPDLKLWSSDEGAWSTASGSSQQPACLVKCLGQPVVAVADAVVTSAVNRACSLVLGLLWDQRTLLHRFRALKADIQRHKLLEASLQDEDEQAANGKKKDTKKQDTKKQPPKRSNPKDDATTA